MIRLLQNYLTGATAHWTALHARVFDHYWASASRLKDNSPMWCAVFAEAVVTARHCATLVFGPSRQRLSTNRITSKMLLSVTESDLREFYDAIVMAFVRLFVNEHQEFIEPCLKGAGRFLDGNFIVASAYSESVRHTSILSEETRRAIRNVSVFPDEDPLLEYCLTASVYESYVKRAPRIRHRINSEYRGRERDAVPERLYKYRRWSDALHRRIITHREIYLSSPEELNDSLDCRVSVRGDVFIADVERWHYGALAGGAYGTVNEPERTADAKEMALVNGHLGVFSLAKVHDNPVMWDHYADKHCGFCVEFDFAVIAGRFHYGQSVAYADSLPVVSHAEPGLEAVRKQFFTKRLEWRHEREYRLIRFEADELEPGARRLVLPEEAFVSIIVGRNMAQSVQQDIRSAAAQSLRRARIYQASHDEPGAR